VRTQGGEWLVRYPRGAGCALKIRDFISQHRDACWNVYTPATRPDFTQEPALVPVPAHEAAFFLLRELKHALLGERRQGSMRPGALLAHIGALLSGVACYRLSPSPQKRRLALVQELLAAGVRP
jgi:hypothetical protein